MTDHATRRENLRLMMEAETDPASKQNLADAIQALDFLGHVRTSTTIGSRIAFLRPITAAAWAQNAALCRTVPEQPALDMVEVQANLNADRAAYDADLSPSELHERYT